MTNPVLAENDGKRILHQNCRFINGFSETVMTNAVLKEIEGKLTMHPKSPKVGSFAHFLSRI